MQLQLSLLDCEAAPLPNDSIGTLTCPVRLPAMCSCAEGTWCKAYEATNATWFCSNPCAYTCEPQQNK